MFGGLGSGLGLAVGGAVGGPGCGGYLDYHAAAAPGAIAGRLKCPGSPAGVVGAGLARRWWLAAVVAVPWAVVHRRPA